MSRLAPHPLLPALLTAALGLLPPPAARAHGIQSQLERFGGLSLQLESAFSTGMPASQAEVRLLPPGGSPIALGQTDDHGRIRFQLPPQAGADWEIQVDAGPGHRDYLEVPVAHSGTNSGSSSGTDDSRPGSVLPLRLSHLQGWLMLGLAGSLGGLMLRRPRA
ncbi:MAG: hypothetical protein VKJ44_04090 [Synechococcus sp.]|nr:hypothetical protein [Synechococcus sp.]